MPDNSYSQRVCLAETQKKKFKLNFWVDFFWQKRQNFIPPVHARDKWLILLLAIKIGNAFILLRLPQSVINYDKIFKSLLGWKTFSIWNERKTTKISRKTNSSFFCVYRFSWFIKDCVAGKCPRAINQLSFDTSNFLNFQIFVVELTIRKHLSLVHFFKNVYLLVIAFAVFMQLHPGHEFN